MNQRMRSQAKIKPPPQTSTAPPKPKPEWNNDILENPHKLSRAELLQKKLNSKSKNELAAKEELKEKLEKLKSGIIPKDYKDYTVKGKKEFRSKEAFIKDKTLQKEYENRCYKSKYVQPQIVTNNVDTINDRILINDSSSQVHFTSTLAAHTGQETCYDQPQTTTTYEYSAPKEELDEIQAILQRVKTYQQPSVFTPVQVTQPVKEEMYHPSTSVVYAQEFVKPVTFEPSIVESLQEVEKPENSGFDYLDYKENEDRLEKLRRENMGFFNHVNSQDNYQNESQKGTDFDQLFEKLSLNLNIQDQKPPMTNQNALPSFQMNSGFSITPAKQSNLLESPKSLLPNYNEILNFNDNQQSTNKLFDYPASNFKPVTEQPIYQNKIQSAADILGSQPKPIYSNPLQNKALSNIPNPQPQPAFQAPSSFTLPEEDSQIQKMREMLLSTQQEIDKIIQGSNQVNEIYQSSKSAQGQFFQTNSDNSRIPAPVFGSAIIKDQQLGRGPLHDRSNYFQNQTQNSKYEEDELKPRSYPFGSTYQSMMSYNGIQNQPPAYAQYRQENSLSLKSHLQY